MEGHPGENSGDSIAANICIMESVMVASKPDWELPTGWQQSTEINLVRSATYTIYSRLRSIEWDARRALSLHARIASSLPLFGNLRAGAWYVPTCDDPAGEATDACVNVCCFKSADGHYGQWNVSLRRPNISLLRAAVNGGGAVIVDVTRAGKVWPDALSKALPMWCAVVNAVAGLADPEDCCSSLHLQPSIPASECQSIRKLLPGWVKSWRSSGIDLGVLVPKFVQDGLPLRPLWVRADAGLLWEDGVPSATNLGFVPLVCLTASPPFEKGLRSYLEPDRDLDGTQAFRHVEFPSRRTGFPYVQGAGDDEDAWSCGLSRSLFWKNRDAIFQKLEKISSSVQQSLVLKALINDLQMRSERKQLSSTCNKTASNVNNRMGDTFPDSHFLLFGSRVAAKSSSSSAMVIESKRAASLGAAIVIVLSSKPRTAYSAQCADSASICSDSRSSASIHWFCITNFKGKPDYKNGLCRALGDCLRLLDGALASSSSREFGLPLALIISDSNGGDWAGGLAAAWIAWHCDESLRIHYGQGRAAVDKAYVNGIVLRILANRPDLVVSRHTQQQINRFFQSPAPPSSVAR